ncbi:MAG TPA: hypothetical protein VFE48_05075 [Methylomirabilota bacterium]|nr:hypothetical protein [Methylomirabilota bacterium]
MSDERAFESLSEADLQELRSFADVELHRFTKEVGYPSRKYSTYADRLLAICLVQGAAQHFVDTRPELAVDHSVTVDQAEIDEKGYRVTDDGRVISGVKDIDVVLFFRADPNVPIPSRNHCMKSTV